MRCADELVARERLAADRAEMASNQDWQGERSAPAEASGLDAYRPAELDALWSRVKPEDSAIESRP